MAWTTDDIYALFRKLARTPQAGRLTATEFFYLWNAESLSSFHDLLGPWQARGNGKTGANTGLLLNEIVQTELSPFIKTTSLTITGGAITKPADFAFRLDARVSGRQVRFIRHGQQDEVLSSVIDPPSTTDGTYYAVEYGNTIKLLPSSVTGTVDFDYVSLPVDIKWAYTFDVDGRQVYDAVNSVQPLWSFPMLITITKRAMAALGIGLKDADFITFGRTAQTTGE